MRRAIRLAGLTVGAAACAAPATSALYGGIPLGPFAPTALLAVVEACTLLALLGGGALGGAALARTPPRERLVIAALAGVALTVRLLAPAVPHDVNHRAWGAYTDAALPIERGFGLPALGRLLHPVVQDWAHSDAWLFHANAVVATCGVLALYAWVRQVARPVDDGARARLAALAAGIFALMTPHVRFSHTDAQQIGSVSLALIGLAAWARHARAPSGWTACVAAAALAASATGRIESTALPVTVAMLALVDPVRTPWRAPATWAALVAAVAVAAWHSAALVIDNPAWDAWSYSGDISAASGARHVLFTVGPRHLVALDPTYTHPVLIAAWGVGVALTPLSRAQRGVLILAALGLSCAVPAWSPVGGAMLAVARYQLAALPWVAVLAAGTFARGLAEVGELPSGALRAVGRAGVSAALLGALVATFPLNWMPTTHSAEYAFIHRVLDDPPPAMEPRCTLLVDTWDRDIGLAFPQHLVPMLDPQAPCWAQTCPVRDWRVVDTRHWDGDTTRCVLYYRAATCETAVQDGQASRTATCAGPGPSHRLRALKEAVLPARQWVFDVPTTPTRTVGFYRLMPGAPRGTP